MSASFYKESIMKRVSYVFVILLLVNLGAHAGGNDIDLGQLAGNLKDQADSGFKSLCKDLGQGLNFIPLTPPDPYGLVGFDIGLEATLLNINQGSDYWKYATKDLKQPPLLPVPKLQVQKGLPFGIDLGVIYAFVPQSNVKLYGGEIRWAVMKGSFVKPSIGLRASYTKLAGVPHLNLQTQSIDASISKKIAIVTPYAGVGQIFTQGKASFEYTDPDTGATLSADFNAGGISETRGFVGLKLSLLFLAITAEVDFSRITSYNLKVSAGI